MIAEITAQEELVRSCRLLVKYQKGITTMNPSARYLDGFAEAWLDMTNALKEMENKK